MIRDKIVANRIREARRNKAEKILRAVRLRIFDYEDQGKLEKAQRVIERCKALLRPRWEARARSIENKKLENYFV